MREAHARVGERVRLGRILLGLDDEPSGVPGVAQLAQHCREIDRAVAGNREHAVENCRQEAHVVAQYVGEHRCAHILAVHVHDPRAVAARDRHRVPAGKHQVPRIEQQPHVVAGAGHQPVDLGLRLYDGAHVVVEGQPHAVLPQVPRKFVQLGTQARPGRIGEHRAGGQCRLRIAVGTAMTFGEDHHRATHGAQQGEVIGNGSQLLGH